MLFHQGNGLKHFSKLFNVEDENTVKNNFLKATNPKCVSERKFYTTILRQSKGIKKVIKGTKKASGNDSISSNEKIKTGSPTILPFLVTLFNTILETKRYLRIGHYYSSP